MIIIQIMITIFILLMLLSGVGFILIWQLTKPHADNNKYGIVFIENGQTYSTPKKALLTDINNVGETYKYGANEIVLPKTYCVKFYKHRRMIFTDSKSIIALPMSSDKPLAEKDKNSLLLAFVQSRVGGDIIHEMKSIRKGKLPSVLMVGVVALIIGVVVGVGGNFLIQHFTQGKSITKPPITTTTQTLPQPIGVPK